MRTRPLRGALAGTAFLLTLCASLSLAACTTHRRRPHAAAESESVRASELWLPPGAAPGMFITWTHESRPGGDPTATREMTLACVEASGDAVTMEKRETLVSGATVVTAARYRRDGSLVGVWRGPEGGVGTPLQVGPPMDWKAAQEDMESMRKSAGIPTPRVSTSRDKEWVDTPAGRIECVKDATQVSVLFLKAHFTLWQSVQPLPLSSLVKTEFDLSFMHDLTLLKAFGTTGAKPTLTIPVDGR